MPKNPNDSMFPYSQGFRVVPGSGGRTYININDEDPGESLNPPSRIRRAGRRSGGGGRRAAGGGH